MAFELALYIIFFIFVDIQQASKRDRDRRDKPRGIEGDRDRDGIGMENSEP